eukprot:COSAG02_NODE_2727_length_8152_cov_58.639017_5_plen_173_part_00
MVVRSSGVLYWSLSEHPPAALGRARDATTTSTRRARAWECVEYVRKRAWRRGGSGRRRGQRQVDRCGALHLLSPVWYGRCRQERWLLPKNSCVAVFVKPWTLAAEVRSSSTTTPTTLGVRGRSALRHREAQSGWTLGLSLSSRILTGWKCSTDTALRHLKLADLPAPTSQQG